MRKTTWNHAVNCEQAPFRHILLKMGDIMTSPTKRGIGLTRRGIGGLFAALVLVGMLLAFPQVSPAQTVAEQAPSLTMTPEDAAAYGALLHNKDVFDAVVGSNAYAKVAEMEDVKPLLEMAKMQWKQATGAPSMKGIVQALLDGLSEEMFFYIDPSYMRLMKVYQKANVNGSIVAAAQGIDGPDSMAQMRGMLDVLSDHAGELETPEMVIGIRTKDAESAQGLVSFAKVMIETQLLADAPEVIRANLKDEEVGGVTLVTLKLDGSMIPWQEIPLDEISGQPGKYDPLVAKLKTMTVAISLGAKDNYVLASIGATNEHIGELGTGKGLANRPEFAKLDELTGKKLRSITYASAEAAQLNLEAAMAPVAALAEMIPAMLPPETDDMLRKRIEADVNEFSQDMQGQIPAPGALLSATTFSPRGFDTVTYNWTENLLLDSSQPLTLLDHLGGSPIAYMVARGKEDPQRYDLTVKWLKKFDGYLTEVMEQQGGEDAAKYKKFRTEIDPLLARLDTANREMLMPAMKDGQSALVLDAQLTSKQWAAQMPPSPHPLPMLEPAMVFGVSDAELLKQGCQEYFAVAQEVIRIMHEIDPEEVPATEIPAPKSRDIGVGAVYYYMLPKDAGIDKRIAPNAGLSDSVAVLSLAPLHSKRILEPAPVAAEGPVAQFKDKPIGAASGFNFAALVDALMPWVEYGMSLGTEFGVQEFDDEFEPAPEFEPEFGGPDPEKIKEYVRTAAEVLKCFRGYSSVTYVEEDGVQVTRGEWHFQDLE